MVIDLPHIENLDTSETENQILENFTPVECPLNHQFAKGIYFREIFMPAGTFVIGHEHKTEHFNVVLSGCAKVLMDGEVVDIIAPCVFVSKPGVRKFLLITEDMRWATIHPTDETDIEKLEDMHIDRSAPLMDYKKVLLQLTESKL
jgi:hypothetical protein